MKLIDKDLLIKEIKERIKKITDMPHLNFTLIGCRSGYKEILSFLDSLEVKEVDLEKEIEMIKGDYEQVDVAWNNDFDFIAKHFFELGLKAMKGGEK